MNARFLAIVLVGTTLFLASSARATTVRTGSGYGQQEGYAACASSSDPCIGVQLASFEDDIDGTEYPVYQYAYLGGSVTTPVTIDLVDFGAVAAGSALALPVLDASLPTGVFSCGTGSVVVDSSFPPKTVTVVNSMGNTVPVPCTPGSQVTSVNQTGVNFTVSPAVSDLVLFTTDGNLDTSGATAAPEPSSLALLGLGLISFAFLSKRRVQA
jgi:PEP-CTERM motif